LSAFTIFDPANLPPQEHIGEYGTNEVNTLCKSSGKSKGETPAVIDSAALQIEWSTFKFQVSFLVCNHLILKRKTLLWRENTLYTTYTIHVNSKFFIG
jgi:hypothetical protein